MYCTIKQLNVTNVELLKPLLKQFLIDTKYGRFLKDARFNNAYFQELELKELINYGLSENIQIAFDNQGIIIGLIGYNFSDWDSNIFDNKVVIIRFFITIEVELFSSYHTANNLLMSFEKWMRNYKNDVVIVKIEALLSSCYKVLVDNNYDFYETISIQSLIISNKVNQSKYRFAEKEDINELRKIALSNTFDKSHFYLDRKFKVSNVDNMYSNWIENAINSDDKIIVIEYNKHIAGMFIFCINNYNNLKIATWEFAAVDKEFRNKGLGKDLFNSAIDACIKEGVSIIDSEFSIKNIKSFVVHSKLNFIPIYSKYTFHKWFN